MPLRPANGSCFLPIALALSLVVVLILFASCVLFIGTMGIIDDIPDTDFVGGMFILFELVFALRLELFAEWLKPRFKLFILLFIALFTGII